MEKITDRNLEVVLSLNEGCDFGYLRESFIIVASLDGNNIKSNPFTPNQCVKFDSELVWTTKKSNFKNMKNYKVPIRIEFYKAGGNQQHFGYIVLSLKTAQNVLLPYSAFKEVEAKVCGLGKEAKGSCPRVKYSLFIRDAENGEAVLSDRNERLVTAALSVSSEPIMDRNVEEVKDGKGNDVDNEERLSPLHIPSKELIATNLVEPPYRIQAYHSFRLDVNLVDINWLCELPNVHFRFHHARADVEWSAHEDITGAVPNMSCTLDGVSGQFRFVEAPTQLESLLNEIPPVITLCTLRQCRPQVLAKAHLLVPTAPQVEVQHTIELQDLKTRDAIAKLTYASRLSDEGPQTFRQLFECHDFDNIADRIKDELEVWKEKEKKQFDEKCKEKLQMEQTLLQSEWSKRHEQLEREANERADECRKLADSLKAATNDLKIRAKELSEKEGSLEAAKADLEVAYQKLVADAKSETANLREDILERLREKDQIICQLRLDAETLRDELMKEKQRRDTLSKEQIETLLNDLKIMQEKLEKANTSKQFFKGQWGRAVREIHRIKTDGWKDIQVQLQYKREELKKLGLEHLFQSGQQSERTQICVSQRNDFRLRELIEERDKLLRTVGSLDNEDLAGLNDEIRRLLDHR